MILEHEDEWPARGERPSIGESEMDAHLAFVLPLLTADDEEERNRSLRGALLDFGIRFMDTLDFMRKQAGLEEKGAELLRLAGEELAVWLRGARLSGEPEEDERRAAAARDVLYQKPDFWPIFPLCADAILNLPQRHQHRDEALAKRAVRFALRQAGLAGEHKTLLWATRRALAYEFGTEAECQEWLEQAERLTAEVDEPDEWFLLWSAACGHLCNHVSESGKEAWEARALSYHNRMVACANTPHDRALAWLRRGQIHAHMDAQGPAADCFEAALAEDALNRDAELRAAVKAGRIRFAEGQYGRVVDLIEPRLERLEAWYVEAVAADDAAVRGAEYKEACDLLALSRMHRDDWGGAVMALERSQGRRFRHEMAVRRNAAARAAESRMRAAERGAPVAPEAAVPRESDWLGYGLTGLTRARQAYWDARAEVAIEPEPRLLFGQLSESLEDDEALIVLGQHGSGTFCAAVRKADREQPSGRFFWPECDQTWVGGLLKGPEAQFLLEVERGTDLDRMAAELEKLRAAMDDRIGRELGAWLEAHGVRRIAIVPHGFYRLTPWWTLPSLERFEVRMLSAVREILPAQTAVEARALIVANPGGDLPLAELEAEAVSSILRGRGFASKTICGDDAGEPEVTAAVAGCGLLHFSGHGLQKMTDSLRSSLLMAPRWSASGLAGPADLAALSADTGWTEPDEESREAVIEGKGLLREIHDVETGDVQRSLDRSEAGTLWIRLDGDRPTQWGELWTAADMLVDARLAQCRVAVLSACSAGVEAIPEVEEPGGVPGALRAAGVRSLVSAFWPVTQELAWLFTVAFYDTLGNDTWDVAGAVHSARQTVRRITREDAAARLRAMTTDVSDLFIRLPLDVAVRRIEQGPDLPFAEAIHWGAFFLQGDARISVGRIG